MTSRKMESIELTRGQGRKAGRAQTEIQGEAVGWRAKSEAGLGAAPISGSYVILALTAGFFAVFAWIFWFYNSVEVWNGQTFHMIYQVSATTILTLLVSVVGLAVTIVMAWYAYATIAEMRKDRRKDLIEKVLVDAYSPLYEILRRARVRFLNERNSIGEMEPRMQYDLEEQDFAQARQILLRYGHYFGTQVQRGVTNALDKFDVKEYNGKKYYRVLADIGRYWDHIEKRREDLEKELEDLTGVSSRRGAV